MNFSTFRPSTVIIETVPQAKRPLPAEFRAGRFTRLVLRLTILALFLAAGAGMAIVPRRFEALFTSQGGFSARLNDAVTMHYSARFVQVETSQEVGRIVFDPRDQDYQKPGTFLSISEARRSAVRRAKENARLHLMATLESLQVQAGHPLSEFMKADYNFAHRLSLLLEKAAFISTRIEPFQVRVSMVFPLSGQESLLHFLPVRYGFDEFPRFELDGPPAESYTGVILDARHLDYRYSMQPRLYTSSGQLVYGPRFVSKNYAVETGLAGYALKLDAARRLGRAGQKPYYTLARGLTGQGSDFILSDKDVQLLFSNTETLTNLSKCRLVILVNKGANRS